MTISSSPALPPPWRRGALFLSGIAGPVLMGLWFGNSEAALPAGVAGLLLCWAEAPGPLADRLRALSVAASAMVFGAALGFLAQIVPALLWPMAFVGSCGVGYAATKQRLWPIATRDGAIAFAIGTVLPPPTTLHAGILGAGLAVIVLSRILDHLLHGPLPTLSGARALDKPVGSFGRWRFALAYGVAATSALALGWWLSPDYAPWVVITTLVVMQPDAGASYRRVLWRIAGALIGVAGAWVSLALVHAPLVMMIAVAVLSAAIPHHFHKRYWLHTALVAWTVLLMHAIGMSDRSAINAMILARLSDMVLGALIAAVATWVAFAALSRK
jgi:hypothetical protein